MANSFNLRSGRSINLLCKGNYTLQKKDKMINERSSQSETMTCSKGKLSPEYECYPSKFFIFKYNQVCLSTAICFEISVYH